jgi:hypothetical protein
MIKWAVAAGALCVSVFVSSAGMADCRITPFRFYPAQNDSVTTSVAITQGSPCTMRFRSLSALVFDSVSIVSRPTGGTAAAAGALQVQYKPNAGFKGSDRFSAKVCGKGSAGAGCSTITYLISVN